MPEKTGSLQVRGRAVWMIYTDETGRKIQANTGTADFAQARRVLARAAITVLQARLARLQEILDEAPAKAAGSRGKHPAARGSRQGANPTRPARAARAGRTNPRPARKGEAA